MGRLEKQSGIQRVFSNTLIIMYESVKRMNQLIRFKKIFVSSPKSRE
jgi:hypothetical protein